MLTSPNAGNKEKDGALHMIGVLIDVLLKRQAYRDQLENILTTYIFPEIQNPAGHMRGRAFWVLQYFSDMKFKNPQILGEIMRLTANSILNDKELPVKVEAGIALKIFLNTQDDAGQFIKGQIKEITKELLTIIRETESEDLMNVLQRLVFTFSEQLYPIAVEICEHLATSFSCVLNSEEGNNEKVFTAMSLLNSIETLLIAMEEQPQIVNSLQPIIINVVGHVFQCNIIG